MSSRQPLLLLLVLLLLGLSVLPTTTGMPPKASVMCLPPPPAGHVQLKLTSHAPITLTTHASAAPLDSAAARKKEQLEAKRAFDRVKQHPVLNEDEEGPTVEYKAADGSIKTMTQVRSHTTQGERAEE